MAAKTSAGLTSEAKGIEARDSCGNIRGAVLYDHWTENSCQAHMAVDSPAVWRSLLPSCFVYPFAHVGIILGVIPAHNKKSCRMTSHLGFNIVHVIAGGWAENDDMILFEMRREDCPWLLGWPPHHMDRWFESFDQDLNKRRWYALGSMLE